MHEEFCLQAVIPKSHKYMLTISVQIWRKKYDTSRYTTQIKDLIKILKKVRGITQKANGITRYS